MDILDNIDVIKIGKYNHVMETAISENKLHFTKIYFEFIFDKEILN